MYNGEDILTYDKKKMWEMRRKLQIIFQDPYSSLNPRMTVYDLISALLRFIKWDEGRTQGNGGRDPSGGWTG